MLSVFQSCSSVANGLRRQNPITFTSIAYRVLDAFNTLAISANDKRLVAWVELQLIAEDIDKGIHYATSLELNGLKDRPVRWKRSLEPGIMNSKLSL